MPPPLRPRFNPLTELPKFSQFKPVEQPRLVTQLELDQLEKLLDQVFAGAHIDVKFTRHFIERVNDERNKKQITIKELQQIFNKVYFEYSAKLAGFHKNLEAVIKDVSTDINIPFALSVNRQGLELVTKTVMRKPDFKSPDPFYRVKTSA